jgi:CheY-like chemotaxis protein
MNALAGKRILVVEDEAIVAAMLEDILLSLGVRVIGPCATLAEGLAAAGSAELDGAVLDVNLRGERVDPLAQALRERGVPIVFATGYGQSLKEQAGMFPVVDKPYTEAQLIEALTRSLNTRE